MNLEQAVVLVNDLLIAQSLRPLNDAERVVFIGAWERQTYETIAHASGYSDSYLRRDVGPKLWRDLSLVLGEQVSKTNFKAALDRKWSQQHLMPLDIGYSEALEILAPNICDWGDAFDVSVFFGRTAEQNILRHWVIADRCRFILLLGMGGIGKTALSIKVAQQIQSDFEFVVWRSLRNAPLLTDLLGDLMIVLSRQLDKQTLQMGEAGMSQFLQYLRQHRCLLILDNAESILQAGDRKRTYRSGFEDYGELFQMVGGTPHQSCFLITSRELPQGLETLIGKEFPVRSLTIRGLNSEDGQALLESIAQFHGSAVQWETILHRYAGNPLALKIVASFVNEVLAGDLSQFFTFLSESSFIFDDIRDLLNQQFLRLSIQEQVVMIWLAIKRELVTLDELLDDLLDPIPPHDLLQVMMALQNRALVVNTKHQFTQQPVVMEFITDYIVESISLQICCWQFGNSIDELRTLNSYALIHLDSQEYVREAQSRFILQPILHKLLSHFREISSLEHHFQLILNALRGNSPSIMGYGAGNIFNLLCVLLVDLTGYDFSQLTLWQANFQGVHLHHVNFSLADLSKTRFTKTFSGVMSLAFSPDGKYLASGDLGGNIILWQLQNGRVLMTITGHKLWVSSLAFSFDSQFLVSGCSDYSLCLWNVQSGQCLHVMLGHESAVSAVTFSLDNKMIASASDDHTARVWDVLTGECLQILQGHNSSIRAVAFSADGRYLMTGSNDCTVKIWDLQSGQIIRSILVILGHSAAVWTVTMSPNGDLIASSSPDLTIRIWQVNTGQCLHVLRGHSAEIWSMSFNPSGLTVATASLDRTVRIWDTQSGECLQVFQGHNDQVWSVAFHPNGKELASGSIDQTIRLWNLETGHCKRVWHGYSKHIYAVTFSPDGNLLASVGDDAIVRLWNWQIGTCTASLTSHSSSVWAVAFHPEHTVLASGGLDQTIRL